MRIGTRKYTVSYFQLMAFEQHIRQCLSLSSVPEELIELKLRLSKLPLWLSVAPFYTDAIDILTFYTYFIKSQDSSQKIM